MNSGLKVVKLFLMIFPVNKLRSMIEGVVMTSRAVLHLLSVNVFNSIRFSRKIRSKCYTYGRHMKKFKNPSRTPNQEPFGEL